MLGYLEGKDHELHFHTVKKNIGLNIDNFISSFAFELTMIREKVVLFLNYLSYFHRLHTKQLTRFSSKIQSLYVHVNKDIKFDEAIRLTEEDKTAPMSSSRSSLVMDEDSGSDSDASEEIHIQIVDASLAAASSVSVINGDEVDKEDVPGIDVVADE
jgi:hypothetical protein